MEAILSPIKEQVKSGVTINVKKTKSTFDSLFKTINHATVLPILEDILIIRGGGKIKYCATDLENTLSICVDDEGPDMSVVFPGTELKYLLRYAYSDDVYFEKVKSNGYEVLSVRAGKFSLTVTPSKIDEYPKFPVIESKKQVTVDTKELLPVLENALKFVSNDQLRPSMTGVLIKDINGMLVVASTDAHRLYWRSFCKTPKDWVGCSFIIPAKSARLTIMAFRNDHTITLTQGDGNHLMVSTEGKEFTCRLIDMRYPDFEKVIPTGDPLQFYVDRHSLVSVVRICNSFSNKSTNQINITLSPDRLDFGGEGGDYSISFKDHVLISSPTIDTFMPFTFGVNAKFLIDALGCSKEPLVKISSSMNPLHAIILDDDNLLMPLMLNQ